MTDNDRYNTWLAQNHPTSPAAFHVWMRPLQSTAISELLSYPENLPLKPPTVNPKSCGRVLTSQENLLILEEKRLAKEGKQREKEAKKRAREEKRE